MDGCPSDDPLGQVLPDPARLRDPEAQPACEPEAGQAERGPEERVPVRRVGDRAVHDPRDAGPGEDGHPSHRGLDDALQALGVRREEVGAESGRDPADAERLGLPLVRTQEKALRLLAQVVRGVDLPEERQLAAERRDLGNRLRHEVLVLHRDDREVQPRQLPDLARPRAGGVHDDLGADLPLIGDDPPLAAGGPRDARHPGAPADPGATVAGALDQGLRHARRVDVAVLRVPHRAQEPARVDERVEPADLLRPDHLEREADRPRLPAMAPVLVHPVRHRGEPEAPGPVEPDRLPRLRLEPLVEVRAREVDPREVQARVEVRRVAGGVPRRARRQLGPLDQHGVGPPRARQVIEHAGADDTAADDGDASDLGHGSASSDGCLFGLREIARSPACELTVAGRVDQPRWRSR